VAGIDAKLQDILLMIPNLPHESVVVGKEASDNPEVRRFGEAPKFAFNPSHIGNSARSSASSIFRAPPKCPVVVSFSIKVLGPDWSGH